eukprot:TRINITY_DN17624_c0_g1_i1.p2 TRINITY_DN17624_c0_g1~~TRINITY_DN17624_c0_g1_i1.p2  ORF type:complete len:152 (+),score=24.18 TRINITY_DN17624_c0_g1_i1:66-521(+)
MIAADFNQESRSMDDSDLTTETLEYVSEEEDAGRPFPSSNPTSSGARRKGRPSGARKLTFGHLYARCAVTNMTDHLHAIEASISQRAGINADELPEPTGIIVDRVLLLAMKAHIDHPNCLDIAAEYLVDLFGMDRNLAAARCQKLFESLDT